MSDTKVELDVVTGVLMPWECVENAKRSDEREYVPASDARELVERLHDVEADYRMLADEARRSGPDGCDPIYCIQAIRCRANDAHEIIEDLLKDITTDDEQWEPDCAVSRARAYLRLTRALLEKP